MHLLILITTISHTIGSTLNADTWHHLDILQFNKTSDIFLLAELFWYNHNCINWKVSLKNTGIDKHIYFGLLSSLIYESMRLSRNHVSMVIFKVKQQKLNNSCIFLIKDNIEDLIGFSDKISTFFSLIVFVRFILRFVQLTYWHIGTLAI